MEHLIQVAQQWAANGTIDTSEGNPQLAHINGFPNHIITTTGEVIVLEYLDTRGNKGRAKVLKQQQTQDGYLTVKLTHAGTGITRTVHRLVAEAFIPRVEDKDTVNHIDGNKRNNNVTNLEWATRSEQMTHAYSLGLKKQTPVMKIMQETTHSKPVICTNKETGDTRYFISARSCSHYFGYSDRWCDKTISSMGGNTKAFALEYTTLNDVIENSDKVSFTTLVKLVQLWAVDKGIANANPERQYLKVVEEVAEIATSLICNNTAELKDAIGDTVVTLIILALQNGTDLEECLQVAYDEIKGRTGKTVDGVFVKDSDLPPVYSNATGLEVGDRLIVIEDIEYLPVGTVVQVDECDPNDDELPYKVSEVGGMAYVWLYWYDLPKLRLLKGEEQ